MTMPDPLRLARCIQRLNKQLQNEVLPDIEDQYARLTSVPIDKFRGAGRKLMTETPVRQYLIDPILKELGWNLLSPSSMLVEAPAESVDSGEHRRFLDYFGQGSLEENRALLVVEAKRLSLSLPEHERGMDAREVMAGALKSAMGRGEEISAEWRNVLCTLRNYAERVGKSDYGVPRRVALTNGEWIIVFLEPERSLVKGVVDPNDFLVVRDADEAVMYANDLHANLAYTSLAKNLPPQHVEDLRNYIADEGEVLSASFSVVISTADFQGVRPVMDIKPLVYVRINEQWVPFQSGAWEPRVLPHGEGLEEDMADLAVEARALLKKLDDQRHLDLVDAASLEATLYKGVPNATSPLLSERRDRSFILYLGKSPTPFLNPEKYEGCPYHGHGPAHAEGYGVPESAILHPSTEPPAYFPSGSEYHCAHKKVHSLRMKRCPIRPMEEFLCCNSCALRERCWPDGLGEFPCVEGNLDDVDVTGA